MIILVGECGCGKSSIEKALVDMYGYETISDSHSFPDISEIPDQTNTVCTLTPKEVRKLRKKTEGGGQPEYDMYVFYIKVPRRDRLIRMFLRGDDIDEAVKRDRIDIAQYRNIEKEVDFVLKNKKNFCDAENMAYWITECIKGNAEICRQNKKSG